MYKMHTKRKRSVNHRHTRRRHSLGHRRVRRAGGFFPNSYRLSGTGRKISDAINKTYTHVTKREGIYNNEPSLFTGKMHKNGQYISGNLFYRERNGKMVGVHATKFHNNSPCGIVTRIHLTGEPILDTHNRPIVETVTCGSDHVDSYPFYQ